jgi:hypothetical protein
LSGVMLATHRQYAAFARQFGDAPDFVEVGEAGMAVDHAMRR